MTIDSMGALRRSNMPVNYNLTPPSQKSSVNKKRRNHPLPDKQPFISSQIYNPETLGIRLRNVWVDTKLSVLFYKGWTSRFQTYPAEPSKKMSTELP